MGGEKSRQDVFREDPVEEAGDHVEDDGVADDRQDQHPEGLITQTRNADENINEKRQDEEHPPHVDRDLDFLVAGQEPLAVREAFVFEVAAQGDFGQIGQGDMEQRKTESGQKTQAQADPGRDVGEMHGSEGLAAKQGGDEPFLLFFMAAEMFESEQVEKAVDDQELQLEAQAVAEVLGLGRRARERR